MICYNARMGNAQLTPGSVKTIELPSIRVTTQYEIHNYCGFPITVFADKPVTIQSGDSRFFEGRASGFHIAPTGK